MKFDRFLAKLFSKKFMIPFAAVLLLVLLLSSCRFTADDWFLCVFCGCVTPDTCFSCGDDCLDCTDKACFDCLWFCTGCIDYDTCHSPEHNEQLSGSCVGKTTVGIFDCINEYCEDCEACK